MTDRRTQGKPTDLEISTTEFETATLANLRREIDKRGLRNPAIGHAIGMSKDSVGRILRGQSSITLGQLARFATVLNLSITDLLPQNDAKFAPQRCEIRTVDKKPNEIRESAMRNSHRSNAATDQQGEILERLTTVIEKLTDKEDDLQISKEQLAVLFTMDHFNDHHKLPTHPEVMTAVGIKHLTQLKRMPRYKAIRKKLEGPIREPKRGHL